MTVQPWEESFQYVKSKTSPEEQEAAVKGLVQRLLPDKADEFFFHVDLSIGPEGKDTFQVTSPGVNASVDIKGTSGVAASWGLLHYLKYVCNAHVSWEADQLSLPNPLPPAQIKITSNDRFRYYQNVCTVSYSMAWWKWSRWEREIDWMAMNAINIPLAFTGQEAIWQRVYTKLGVTQEELDKHFVGPAFFAWGRMGNLLKWGGPLTESWHNQTLALQHKILQRMREFGMTPILPAFAGHVPGGLARVFPDANITRLGPWAHFNCTYSCSYLLDPNDPLFKRIGSDFIKELTAEFGTDHLYNCDTFNEMNPHSSNLDYLASTGAAVFSGMTGADPNAIWVMQGWLFFNSRLFWRKRQAKALLTSVPLGRMLVLDLASELVPQYARLESYFGQPFIFCMLHDYGGVDGFFGNVDTLLQHMETARKFPNVTVVGTGFTPEGINQNYVMYDFMSELAWRTTSPNVTIWAASYASRRYGSSEPRLKEAWQLLMRSVYNCHVDLRYHGKNVILMRQPRLDPPHLIWYSVDDVVKAWDLIIDVINDSKSMEMEGMQRIRKESEEQEGTGDGNASEEESKNKFEKESAEEEESNDKFEDEGSKEDSEEESKEEFEGEEGRAGNLEQYHNHHHQQLVSELRLLPSSLAASLGNPSEQQHIIPVVDAAMLQSSPDIERMHVSQGRFIKTTRNHQKAFVDIQGSNDGVHAMDETVALLDKDKEIERIKKDDGDTQGQMRSEVTLPLTSRPTFLHDVVDMTRQILQILGGEIALSMIDHFNNGDVLGVKNDHKTIQMILNDMDVMLASSPDFLLGAWTQSAASWATNEKERELYVYNALNQLTLWGPNGEIMDYAIKQWSGLISNYIAPRWEAFGNQLVDCLEKGEPFDQGAFSKVVFEQVEEPFSKNVNATYPSQPTGDTIAMALLLHEKYRPFFNESLQDSARELQRQHMLLPSRRPSGMVAAVKKNRKEKTRKGRRRWRKHQQQQHRGRVANVNKLLSQEEDKERLENSIWKKT